MTKFYATGWKGSPQTRGRKRGTPPKKTLFYRYWLVWCENGCRMQMHRHAAYHKVYPAPMVKTWFIADKFLKFYSCSHKTCKTITYMSVGIVGLSLVRARQCASTPSLQNGCVFESQDVWFHDPMLLSADTMNILHQRTRLSSPLKQGSNWQHQLRLASLNLWHIMTSVLRHD